MKIALVKPYSSSDHIQPALGLGFIASYLRKNGFNDITIVDCLKEDLPIAAFKEFVKKNYFKIWGFQFLTFESKFISEATAAVKKEYPDSIVIAGGPHTTAEYENVLKKYKFIDFVAVGEGEKPMLKILKGEPLSEIENLAYRSGREIKLNKIVINEELDEIGAPAWDLIHPENYPPAQHGAFYENFPIAPVILTRGCPFDCSFCGGNKILGRKFRTRSVQNIIDEIKNLYYDYGIREFHIIDDNFILNKQFAVDFLTALKSLNLNASFATPNGIRLDSLNDEILKLLKENNFYLLSFGIESGNNEILKSMDKSLTVEKIKEQIKLVEKYNFDMAGFFILGYPGETFKTAFQTVLFSLKLPLMRANYFSFFPLPGTRIYYQLKEQGKLNYIDYDDIDFSKTYYYPDTANKYALLLLRKAAFFIFYFRIRILWYNLKKIKNFKHFMFLAKRFTRWFI